MSAVQRLLVCIISLAALASPAGAQPTYKLDVKPEFKPRAQLKLAGDQILRTPVANDPGFRLQLHFRKEGKTVQVVEVRRLAAVPVPAKEPGVFTAVLEVFYPAYKGGMAQKGEFRPISNVLHFRVEAGTPVRITRIIVPPSLAARTAAGLPVPLLP